MSTPALNWCPSFYGIDHAAHLLFVRVSFDQHCNVSDIPAVHMVLKMGQEVLGKQPWPPGKLVLLILALCLLISAAGAPIVPCGDGPSALLRFFSFSV